MPESLCPAQPGAQLVHRQPLRLVLHVAPTLDEASKARRAVIDGIKGWQLPFSPDRLADVAVCAGEVIANAVLHTGKPSTLTTQWTGEAVRLELQDADPRIPQRQQGSTSAESGRGLELLQALANRWGVIPLTVRRADGTSAGKTVWFECGPEAPPETSLWTGTGGRTIRLGRAG
ncbi:ATP-binding protein [Kitasatospora sp. MAP5-34]|uniref:ATP-binding protein n=1 Tax=Kitasatospora sp. MAP5-34 TaxID=3035102 RepID=UPI002476F916|nr:ATP-binding protein [Kitasatospora sp. MAP5-34]MDH6578591.1 hypothetical protein [Kitasatospora sp. MAP5-34]